MIVFQIVTFTTTYEAYELMVDLRQEPFFASEYNCNKNRASPIKLGAEAAIQVISPSEGVFDSIHVVVLLFD